MMLPLALFASGCSVSSLLNESEKEAEKTVDIMCEQCGDLFSDDAACEEAFSSNLYNDDECTIEALQTDAGASKETINCVIGAQKDYNDCLRDGVDCIDPSGQLACLAILTSKLDDCPELPQSVNEALVACG